MQYEKISSYIAILINYYYRKSILNVAHLITKAQCTRFYVWRVLAAEPSEVIHSLAPTGKNREKNEIINHVYLS